MSVRVMSDVWKKSQHKGSELLVMLAMADNTDEDSRECFPSIGYLAEKTRMSRRGVQYILRKLEASGELVKLKEGQGNRAAVWKISSFQSEGVQSLRGAATVAPSTVIEPLPLSESVRSGTPVEENPALRDELERRTTTSGGAQEMTAAFVDRFTALTNGLSPSPRVVGAVAQMAGQLAKSGVTLPEFDAGVELMLQKQKVSPSLLPQFIAEAQLPARAYTNGAQRFGRGVTVADGIARTQSALDNGR